MISVHFRWTISANRQMQYQALLFLRSIRSLKNYRCTICIQEKELDLVWDRLKSKVEIRLYKTDERFTSPWDSNPEWQIEPQGDVIVGLDTDVIMWSVENFIPYVEFCYKNKFLCGTMANNMPSGFFGKIYGRRYSQFFSGLEWTKEHWEGIAKALEVDLKHGCFSEKSQIEGPFYINNGVVMLPKEHLKLFRDGLNKWLPVVNDKFKSFKFFAQISNTLAINDMKIPYSNLPRYFNYLEIGNEKMDNINKAAFFHYNLSKYAMNGTNNTNKIHNDIFKQKIANLKVGLC